jgi:hypothetical protein
MKKIGEGWQYSVYDLGNGRVLKKYHSPFKSYWVILKNIFPFKNDSIFKIPIFSKSVKRKAVTSFTILKQGKIPPAWIDNPKLLTGLNYEQDKEQPLHDIFEKMNTTEIKKTIDKFVTFNKRLLAIGIIDKSFNITKNFGLNKNDEIILIDIGELFDNPERIKNQLLDRAWDRDYVAGCIKDFEAQKYFIQKMDDNFKV